MRPENRELLGPNDVLLVSHPGSGTSWISALLVHLGVFYAAGEEERLVDAESQRIDGWFEDAEHRLPSTTTPPEHAAEASADAVSLQDQQRHLPALRGRELLDRSYREPLRVIHTGGAAVGWAPRNKVVLLVRDGRDAVLSLYHNLVGFSGLGASLQEYLRGGDGAWLPPAASWGFHVLSWLGAVPPERLHVLRFETCREDPLGEFGSLLRFLGIERDDDELRRAVERSSYRSMRDEESREIDAHGEAIGRSRILRKGRVGEWRDVYTPEMLATFAGMPRRALDRLGYD